MSSQMERERHVARPGRVPVELGCITHSVWNVHPPGSLPKPRATGMLMGASSWRPHGSLTPFPAPSPLWRRWGWPCGCCKFQASLVFLVASPHPGARPESPHQDKRYSHHPGNRRAFRSRDLCTYYIYYIDTPSAPSGVLSSDSHCPDGARPQL